MNNLLLILVIRRDFPGLRNAVTSLRAGRGFSILDSFHTDPGTHRISCPMCTGGCFPGSEADHSHLSSTEVKNEWSCIIFQPLYSNMASWHAQGQLYLYRFAF